MLRHRVRILLKAMSSYHAEPVQGSYTVTHRYLCSELQMTATDLRCSKWVSLNDCKCNLTEAAGAMQGRQGQRGEAKVMEQKV